MQDEALYTELDAVRAAYATASWEEVEALAERQAAVLEEITSRSLERQRAQLRAAGLPEAWARA